MTFCCFCCLTIAIASVEQEGMFNNANVIFRTKFVDGVSTVTRTIGTGSSRAHPLANVDAEKAESQGKSRRRARGAAGKENSRV